MKQIKTEKIFCILLFCFHFIFIYIIFISSFKNSVMGIYFPYKEIINTFLPQGWGFFTKDPREKMTEIYIKKGDHLQRIDFLNNDIQNYFGISRKSRRIGMDVGMIYEQIKNKSFYASIDQITTKEKIQFWDRLYALQNIETTHLYIVEKEYMPWAYYTNTKKTFKNLRYLAFEPE